MKHLKLVAALLIATSPALAADIGVSLNIGEPGFYGRIDIGDFPAPQVLYQKPMNLQRIPVSRQPIYLHVPPGHAKNWRKHCGKYNACGERVYFVQDNWYNQEYVPRYKERHDRRDNDRRNERDDDQRRDKPHGPRGDKTDHGRNR